MNENLIKNYLSKAEFARLAGVTPPTITGAIQGPLASAMSGGKIDITAPCVVDYLAKRKQRKQRKEIRAAIIRTEAPEPASEIAAPPPAEMPAPQNEQLSDTAIDEIKRIFPQARTPGQIGMIAELTVRQVAEQFTSASGASEYVTIIKKLEDTRMVQLKISEKEGELIPRELVRGSIIGMLDALHVRLLRDAPRTIASRVYAQAKSGAPMEEAETLIHDVISQHLKGYVKTAKRILASKLVVADDVQ